MNTPIKWTAELKHVREVSLLGTADLAFWKDRLIKEELLPVDCDGRAKLLIVAADSKFMGVRSPDSEVFQALMDSHFVANEWAVRDDTTHAKSKTYSRAEVLPGVTHDEAADR